MEIVKEVGSYNVARYYANGINRADQAPYYGDIYTSREEVLKKYPDSIVLIGYGVHCLNGTAHDEALDWYESIEDAVDFIQENDQENYTFEEMVVLLKDRGYIIYQENLNFDLEKMDEYVKEFGYSAIWESEKISHFTKMKEFEVCYSIRGSRTIYASSPEEARKLLLNSDYTDTKELIQGVESNILNAGNDAINIDDIYETNIINM